MTTLGNGQILENGMKLVGVGLEDPLVKKLKPDEAENICKSLFKDQAIIAGCGLVLPEVPISGTLT